MKPKVFIDGEHGTTGLQIRSRLQGRTDIEVVSIPQAERRNAAMRRDRLNEADVAILCLPDEGSREAVSMVEGNNAVRVIDTSTAHRIDERWTYGFAEMEEAQADRIAAARLVTNPGCYPTGAIALLRPLRAAGLLSESYPVSINAVSGYTGGGKQMVARMEDPSHDEAIDAPHFLYGLTLAHKHVPEMTKHGLLARQPLFSPSVGRFPQGMIVQVPLYLEDLPGAPSMEDVHGLLSDHYAGREIVTVTPLAESREIARLDPTLLNGTDRMRLYVFGTPGSGRANLVALLDNLGKGASGAAVQNMELMLAD
ncbi:N-acetyl-gamma-glutamyl-phosphate reductase [Pararhizobium mangrovi]|uniref:N-acetyl-gamma-glutamyl-phosphate reductase n=1 Tax=Pararhizobium mangrovi TaxID=2590452 RepID=A0A506U917_9HYPH|nr:N-acetyl-gamma-glutamyl-phosphate reductase [Pararhizobium mangrovi]TPW29846.1 N-acetyl-gamma-glutamyl-phosphate reductase [Pararhizobium mangrovi]